MKTERVNNKADVGKGSPVVVEVSPRAIHTRFVSVEAGTSAGKVWPVLFSGGTCIVPHLCRAVLCTVGVDNSAFVVARNPTGPTHSAGAHSTGYFTKQRNCTDSKGSANKSVLDFLLTGFETV